MNASLSVDDLVVCELRSNARPEPASYPKQYSIVQGSGGGNGGNGKRGFVAIAIALGIVAVIALVIFMLRD